MVHCRGRGFSLLVCVFFLSVAAGVYPTWEDTGRVDEVITDNNTGHVYTAGEKGIRHWSENLTFIAGVGWGDADDCVGDAGGNVTAMALQPGSPRLLACSTACGGLCAVYNTSNITQRLWMNKETNHSYINTRSVLVFLDNVTLLVASSTSNKPTPVVPVLSYRHLSFPDQGQPSMNISDNTESVISRKPESNYAIHFISGFTKNNFTYFLTTQRETSSMNVTTRLIRFCTSYESLFPLMDFPLDCRTKDLTLYNIGLDMADTGSSITVSFGKNTDQSDFQQDPSLGSALCQYTFEDIRNESSNVLCKLSTTSNVSWADVTGGCYVQDGQCKVCQRTQCQGTFLITDNQKLFNYKSFKSDFNAVYRNNTIVITTVLPSEAETVNVATSAGEVLQLTTGVDGNLSLSSNMSVSGDSSLPRRVVVRDSNDFLHLFTISSNTVKEVDICKGRRCQECRRISRCSWCKKCVFSEACGGSTCKVQNWYPKKGPGGTVITFEGCGFNETDNQVAVAGRKCQLKGTSLTRRQCTLGKKPGQENQNVKKDEMKVQFPDCSLGNFTITPDPVITDVFPTTSIQSGGLTITVVGENFDAIQQPRINMTVFNSTHGANCTRTNKPTQGKVFCVTPPFVTENRNKTTGNLSVIMDGVIKHYNITVYPDPTLVYSRTPVVVSEGDMLNIPATFDGVNETDVRVEIGPSNCSNVHFNGTLITCTPVLMTDANTPRNITVKIGNNLSLYAGQIMFVTRMSPSYHNIIIGSVVTVAVIAIIVVAVAAVCVREYKSALHSRLQSELTSTSADGQNLYFLLESRGVKETLSPELRQRIEQNKVVLPSSRLKLGATIGSGNFGCVYAGMLYPESGEEEGAEKVAIKTMLDNSQNMDLCSFVEEALVMKEFDHENVLQLLGISVSESQQPMVVLPFMANGDLLSFVSDDAKEVRVYDILRWGVDIADGMNYLSTLKLVHRDLAARNCMLNDNLRVKVADFGLCRDIYEKGYYSSDNKKKLPIRWMAPESMERGSYSSKSDVWSLGVVLWEVLTRGATPYPGVDGWDITLFLQHGRRLQQPWFCSNELYGVMMEIWSKDPGLRPTFSEVSESLTTLLKMSSDQEVTSESKDDGYVTFPSCSRYVQLRVPEYFVLETEASRENLDAMPM
ncbi:hepatocyte growth factor receptor-like [Haliotis rufescens]|uniref:hepatocyte growth factor receptor-like n=1 Tax=Haliotis rufescens TaxID=6454 RepID=UPI00201EF993|nr:hepatocyte growth factor receptor-like [Haliotis rufescens]